MDKSKIDEPKPVDLFDLIQSMSRNEKRRFKLEAQVGKGSQSNYEILFDALNDLSVYDDEKLKKKILSKSEDKDKARKLINRLPRERCYLYDYLLDCLRKFSSKKFDYIRLKEMIIDARLLKDRALYKQAGKLLQKAKKIAEQYGNQLALLEINREERSLLWNAKMEKPSQMLEVYMEEKEQIMKHLKMEQEYMDHYARLHVQAAEKAMLTAGQRAELREKYLPILDAERIPDLPLFAQLRLMNGRYNLSILLDDIEESYNIMLIEFEWWKQKRWFRKDEFIRYYVMLGLYMRAHGQKNKIEEAFKVLKEIEQKETPSPAEEFHVFRLVTTKKLFYLINANKLQEAKEMIPVIKRNLKNKLLPKAYAIGITFNIGTLYLLFGNFKTALDWYNQASKGIKTGQLTEDKRAARLISCICYYELDSENKFENQARTINRFNKDEEPNDIRYFERNVLRLLRRILFSLDSKRGTEQQKLKEFLEGYKANSARKNITGFDEFWIWNESRLYDISMAQAFERLLAKG